MNYAVKLMIPVLVLTFGLTGTIQAAGDPFNSESEQLVTIQGNVQNVEGEIYTIKDKDGKEISLRIEEGVFQGKKPQEGDKLQAKVLMGSIMYNVISAKKAGQGSSSMSSEPSSPQDQEGSSASGQPQQEQMGKSSPMQGQTQQHDQQGQSEKFTKTIQGTVQKVDGNIYYVQTEQGEEVRLRLDQSANTESDIKEGDIIEALVTQEKEFHVISAQAAQE